MKSLLYSLRRPLLALALALALTPAAVAQTGQPDTPQPSLAQALNPDGTLRPGAAGSFDARRFRMYTALNGQPVFRPAGSSGADDYRWQSGFGLPEGTNGSISAVVQAGNSIYIGGDFTAVGNIVANHVAQWDGTTWSSVGTGLANGVNNSVLALVVAGNGDLYVAGGFGQAGTVAANSVAKWNGTAWSALGTGLTVAGSGGATYPGEGTALAMAPNGNVYVGGYFDFAGATAASNIAKWDGTTWSALGTGVTGSKAEVYALAVTAAGEVYAGGYFSTAGGVANTTGLARWNGSTWNALGTGLGSSGHVSALALAGNGDVYVGGNFYQAGPTAANNIARWNGTAWATLGSGTTNGISGGVYALTVAGNGDLYVGGYFNSIGTGNNNANSVARWNGTAWSAVGTVVPSLNNPQVVQALALAANGDVYIGGRLSKAGGVAVSHLAKWNGTAWSGLGTGAGQGINDAVAAVALAPNGNVYVGGTFSQAGGVPANNIARWNGTAWTALGTGTANGVDSEVNALAVAANGDVYLGGGFRQAGGAAASGVARWNGTSWSALGTGLQNRTYSGRAAVLKLDGSGNLYVGGTFDGAGGTPANNVARWNGSAWSSLGSGAGSVLNDDYVQALGLDGSGNLYAAGRFAQAGGVAVSGVARWNGTSWSALGTGLTLLYNGTTYPGEGTALAMAPNGTVYVGGFFNRAGGTAAACIAQWNGTAWSALGSGLNNFLVEDAGVQALAVAANGDLYLGGYFTQIGGNPIGNIAKWSGSAWGALGTGLNGPVAALAVASSNKLYAGGRFGGVGDGSKVSSCFAIYDPAAVNATRAAATAALRLYPNPAYDYAMVQLLPGSAKMPLVLLDALGREVRRYPAPAGAEATLDLRGLPAGLYVVRAGSGSVRLVVE